MHLVWRCWLAGPLSYAEAWAWVRAGFALVNGQPVRCPLTPLYLGDVLVVPPVLAGVAPAGGFGKP